MRVTTFWNEFIVNYCFPKNCLTDQGHNFESQLVKELCKLVQIWKVQMTPYHPEANGQCERLNQTLITMIGILKTKTITTGKTIFSHKCMPIMAPKTMPWTLGPYYLMYRCKSHLPIDIPFGLISPQSEEHFHNKFMAKLSAQLWWCYELANQHQCMESTLQKQWYNQNMRASRLEPSDVCPVWQKVFGVKHKTWDHWENMKYVVVE